MNLQRISEFAEIQEGNKFFITYMDRTLAFAQGWGITSGSFHPGKPDELRHFG